jgi:hypothetical protein
MDRLRPRESLINLKLLMKHKSLRAAGDHVSAVRYQPACLFSSP